MTDHDHPSAPPDEHSTGERLAAYLAGDLDEFTTRALEHELRADPQLRADLERIHDTMLRIRRVAAVTPPEGLQDRVRARVRDAGPAPSTATDTTVGAATTPRRAPQPWWRRPIAAVAALALLAVVAVSSLSLGPAGGGGEATDGELAAGSAPTQAPDTAAEDGAAEDGAGTLEAPADQEAAAAVPEEEEAGSDGAGRSDLSATSVLPSVVVEAGDLSSAEEQDALLAALREDPTVADVLAGAAREQAWIEEAREALRAGGLDEECIEVLDDRGELAQVVRGRADGVPVVGAVTAVEGDLRLQLVEAEGCAPVAERTG